MIAAPRPTTRRPPRRRAAVLLAGVLTALALLTGACSDLGRTGSSNYVSGDGTIREIAAADRAEPISLSGEDLDGNRVDLASMRGKPVVVVVWGSWCVDCRAEARTVTAVAKKLEGRAHFLGIDIRDPGREQAKAYERTFDVPYPSLYSPGGEALLSFPGTLSPNTIPGFVVLDPQGRVAASILGQLPSATTLEDLVATAARSGSGEDKASAGRSS